MYKIGNELEGQRGEDGVWYVVFGIRVSGCEFRPG